MDPFTVSEAELERAADMLRRGGLVAIPTETVYGLAANALDSDAVRRIYELKGRPAASPLIVHVASLEMARDLSSDWPAGGDILAGRYWPGPLTIVVPKRDVVPDIVTAGLPTVALRMPAHPIALALIHRVGLPLAAPSANKFARLSPTTAAHVRDALGDAVMILDGGPCEVGIESTVISLVGDMPALLRPGMVAIQELEDVLGLGVAVAGNPQGSHPSPGMHERHYSPRTRLVVVSGGGGLPAGRGIYLWREHPAPGKRSVRMPRDPLAFAQILYHALHQADEEGVDWIAIEAPPEGNPAWAAIADRLRRAAER